MNRQTAFNKAATHLIKQGCRAMDRKTHRCVYRLSQGRGNAKLKCAIGAIITDKQYRRRFDKDNISAMALAEFSTLLPKFFNKEGAFLRELQIVHDGARDAQGHAFREHIATRLRAFAVEHSLDASKVEIALAKYDKAA